MDESRLFEIIRQVSNILKASIALMVIILSLMVYFASEIIRARSSEKSTVLTTKNVPPEVVDGIHQASGLVDAPGVHLVIQNCTSCHSSKLITQNAMTKEGWKSTIQWMQETQNLWDLGGNEQTILEYLASNYAPQKTGRRRNLKKIEWYSLQN